MKTKVLLVSIAAIIIIVGGYFLFFSGNQELDKVLKSLNAQNYDMAAAKLKEMLYDDENNLEAKGLLIYAQARLAFEEKGIKTYKKAINVTFPNLLRMKSLLYQNRLNELGYLNQKDKEHFLKDSKDYRQQLSKIGVTTEDMNELESILKEIASIGAEKLKISQGDEVDQAIYSFILAGNSFFGNKESGTNLLKIAKLNDQATPLFLFCGEGFVEDLEKEAQNDQSLFGNIAKHLVAKRKIQEIIPELIDKYPKMQSAYTNLAEENYSLAKSLSTDYTNNAIFFDGGVFDDYIKILENNQKAGIDVSIYLEENNNIISVYLFDPTQSKYISRFYSFIDKDLSLINFTENGSVKSEFINASAPVRLYQYDDKKSEFMLATDKMIKKTRYRTQEKYNPQKYYSQYYGYTGGYDYVQVPYESEELGTSTKTFKLFKNKADMISEYDPSIPDYENETGESGY